MDNRIDVKVTASTQGVQAGMKQAASSVTGAAKSMKSAHGDLANSSSSVFSRLKTNISNFASQHKQHFEHMGHDVSSFKGAFVGAFAGAAIGGALLEFGEKIGEAVLHVAEMGDQMLKTSQKVGIGVEQLSKLKYAAELSDVSFGQMTKGMERFARNVSTVGSQSNDASRALSQLGIETKTAEGKTKDMTTLLGEVADKFKGAEDGTNKTAIAMALFGKAGADMIPFLNQGSDGIKELGDEAEHLGVVFDQETAESSEKLNDDLKRMNTAVTGMTQQLVSQFVPILADVAKGLLESAKQGGLLHGVFQGIAVIAKTVISAFEGVALAVRTMATFIQTVFTQITNGVASFVSAVTKLMKGDFTGAFAEAKAGLSTFDKSAETMFKSVQKDAEETAHQVAKLWGLVKDPPKPKEAVAKKKALGSLGDAQDADKEAKAAAAAEAKARKDMAREVAQENKQIDRDLARERKAALKEELDIKRDMGREDAKIAKDLEREREALKKQQAKAAEKAAKQEIEVAATVASENRRIDEQLEKERERDRKKRADEEARIAKEMEKIDADLAKAYEREAQQQQKAAERAQKEELRIKYELEREDLAIEKRLELENQKRHQQEVRAAALAAKEEIQIKAEVLKEDQKIEKELQKEHQKQLNDDVKAQQKAAKEEQQIRATLAKENAQIDKQLQKEHEQVFKDMVKPVSQAFGQMTIGVLRGNQTISEASKKLGVDVATSYGNMAAQMLLKWVESQVEMTAVQELETAKRIALQGAAGAEALALQAAQALKQLFNYAIQAFGGTVAATAALGPEVSVPAGTAVMGTVLGEAASIASAAGGYDVPRDMIAKVHEKEMILPRALSDKVRTMTDGGAGGDVHLHVHAIDGASVKKLFQNNGDLLSSVLRDQMRNFRTA